MIVSGLIPDVPTPRSAKAVFRELLRCPYCGGSGYRVIGSSPPEQEGCTWCHAEGERFWSDGIEYYTEQGTTAMDIVNVNRQMRGEAVCYGFALMSYEGFHHPK